MMVIIIMPEYGSNLIGKPTTEGGGLVAFELTPNGSVAERSESRISKWKALEIIFIPPA
jgi:hypothetical protein